MSEPGHFLLEPLLDVAERIVADPGCEARRVAEVELLGLAVLVRQQHAMIRAAGLAYPRLPEPPAPAEGGRP